MNQPNRKLPEIRKPDDWLDTAQFIQWASGQADFLLSKATKEKAVVRLRALNTFVDVWTRARAEFEIETCNKLRLESEGIKNENNITKNNSKN